MVVIKECFPSQGEFITNYLAKRRQQLEILKQREFKVSFVPHMDDNIIPFEENLEVYESKNLSEGLTELDLKTPVIIPVQEEPRYVKNFNTFIQQTHQHLNEVLSNNQRIDDVHDIVNEIQNPIQKNKSVGCMAIDPNSTKRKICRVTSDLYSSHSRNFDQQQKHENAAKPRILEKRSIKTPLKVASKALKQQDVENRNQQKLKALSSGASSTRSVKTADIHFQKSELARRATTPKRNGFLSKTPSGGVKSLKSRSVTFTPRSITSCSESRTSIASSRSERNWLNNKMSQVPVTVINLQL